MHNKRKLNLITISGCAYLALAALGFTYAQTSENKPAPVKAEGETSFTNGDFEAGNLSGWTESDTSGTFTPIIPSSDTYWTDRLYYANGSYLFNGFTNEAWEGTFTSTSFVLGGEGYISALMGGGKDQSLCYIDVQNASNVSLAHLANKAFADPSRALNLSLNYVYLPSHVGETLHLVITDNSNRNFGALTLDDIKVSQTKTQLDASIVAEKAKVASASDTSAQGLQALYALYTSDANHIINPSFETGNLYGWDLLTTPSAWDPNAAISSDTTYWTETVPFNKEGTYFFDGWTANATESDTYSLRSSSFTLGGTGYLSFKMGGRTGVAYLYRTDGTEVAKITTTAYNSSSFPSVKNGNRQGTMVRYVLDMSNFVGDQFYFVFADEGTSDWGVLFFDDIQTSYASVPDVASSSDSVDQPYTSDTGVAIAWANASNAYGDGASANSYLTTYHAARVSGSICYLLESANSAQLTSLLDGYNALSASAKKIVYSTTDISGVTVGQSLSFLAAQSHYATGIVAPSAKVSVAENPSMTFPLILSSVFVVGLIIVLGLAYKKRHQ